MLLSDVGTRWQIRPVQLPEANLSGYAPAAEGQAAGTTEDAHGQACPMGSHEMPRERAAKQATFGAAV
jgi:hypothetical protein